MKKKTAYVNAILKKKRTVTFRNEVYEIDVPKIVDKKTARHLRRTGWFKFKKVEDESLKIKKVSDENPETNQEG